MCCADLVDNEAAVRPRLLQMKKDGVECLGIVIAPDETRRASSSSSSSSPHPKWKERRRRRTTSCSLCVSLSTWVSITVFSLFFGWRLIGGRRMCHISSRRRRENGGFPSFSGCAEHIKGKQLSPLFSWGLVAVFCQASSLSGCTTVRMRYRNGHFLSYIVHFEQLIAFTLHEKN